MPPALCALARTLPLAFALCACPPARTPEPPSPPARLRRHDPAPASSPSPVEPVPPSDATPNSARLPTAALLGVGR
jgi:hypothetical protein